MKITLSHPHGNANSYQAALALAENNWLGSFQTGVIETPGATKLFRLLPEDLRRRLLNRRFDQIPEPNRQSHFVWETIFRLGKAARPQGPTSRVGWYDVLFCGHDFQVARDLEQGLSGVYAYEDGAKRTFTTARRRDIATLYELPLGYYRGVAEEMSRAQRDYPHLGVSACAEPVWKQVRKDAELGLADLIVVPCDWAADSLRYDNDCRKTPVVKVPYGTPADQVQERTERPKGPLTVLFAGQVGVRKGVPHLVDAWERLQLKDARLWLAGSMALERNYQSQHADSFEYLGALPRIELLERMRRADLFVFPSLAEGFGLVIGEAMAAGVPVLTTQNTGGPELITDGQEGWSVAAHSVEALAERLEWAYANRDSLYEMGTRARRRAEQWTWADYRRKLVAELSSHIG